MTNEEAITDLCLAQADVFYRSKDESIDKAIEALKNHISLEDIKTEILELFNEPAYYIPNYDAYKKCLEIIDKHIKENKEK